MAEKTLERYMALTPLLRFHQPVPVGRWVRLEPETGKILGLSKAVPESLIDVDMPAPAVIEGIIESGACFADGTLVEAKRMRLSAAQCKALVRENAEAFIKQRGGGLALVKGVTSEDLKGWGGK